MNKTKLIAGVFIILASIGITYYVVEGDTAYYCEDTNLVGICWKLSKVNAAGLQTRCYYNESAPTRYKNCKSGWFEFTEEIIGNETEIEEIGVDITFEMDKTDTLASLGIGKFEIRNQTCIVWNETFIEELNETIIGECLEIDNSFLGYDQPKVDYYCEDYVCYYHIFQYRGINKLLDFKSKTCLNYSEMNETNIEVECINWKILTDKEIEEQVINLSLSKLNEIAEIRKPKEIISPTIKTIILNIE